MNRLLPTLALCATLAACGAKDEHTSSQNVALGGEVIARVGDFSIARRSVIASAAVRGEAPKDTLEALVDDALFAKWAVSKQVDRRTDVVWSLRTARARALVDKFKRDAVDRGEPTDDEVNEFSKEAWREVEVPESVVVRHAIAIRGKEKDPAKIARIRDVGEALQRAVAGAKSSDEFKRFATAVPHEGVTVKVEDLPAIVPDGRIVESDGRMDPTFSKAAGELRSVGAISDLVETKFGWHVIYLMERRAAVSVPMEERRKLFAARIVDGRAQRAISGLIEEARKVRPIEIAPDADALMAKALAPTPTTEE